MSEHTPAASVQALFSSSEEKRPLTFTVISDAGQGRTFTVVSKASMTSLTFTVISTVTGFL